MSSDYKETRMQWAGVPGLQHRSVPMWDDTKVMVAVRFAAWHLPEPAPDLAAFFGSFPTDARVNISDGDENPGDVEVEWLEDATAQDLAEFEAAQAADREAAAEREAFAAWKAERDTSNEVAS